MILFLFLAQAITARPQVTVDHSSPYDSPDYLVKDVLMGKGVTASNITFQGDSMQISYFDDGDPSIDISRGVLLSTGQVDSVPGPNTSESTSWAFSGGGDADLDQAQGTGSSMDAAVLEFDFVPVGDSVRFNYVFSSEEYEEFVCSSFNDVFGFFISGPGINGPYSNNAENIALIPGSSTEVAINNVNDSTSSLFDCPGGSCPCNPAYYKSHYGSTEIEFDGSTVKLTAKAEVQCGSTYHIKLAVGDVTDELYDSGVFLEAESFYSPPVTVNIDDDEIPSDSTLVEGCEGASFYFVRSDDDTAATHYFDIGGNAVNGTDYDPIADSVTFAPGQDSAKVTIDPIADGVPEGIDTVELTVYNVTVCGDTIPEKASLYIKDEYSIATSAPDTSTACPEDSVDLIVNSTGGDGPYDHVWSNGATEDTISVSPPSTDTLTVQATDSRDCKGIDSMVVVEVDSFQAGAKGDTIVCIGDSAELEASGGQNYDWSPGDEVSDSTIPKPKAAPQGDSEYSVSISDSVGCTVEDTVSVDVQDTALYQAGPDTAICRGDSVQLIASDVDSLLWTPTDSMSDSTVKDPRVWPDTGTSYRVIMRDSLGCTGRDTTEVKVDSTAQLEAGPDTSACPSDSVAIGGSPTDPNSNALSWSPSNGLDDPNAANPKAAPSSSTTYRVSAKGKCVFPDSMELSILSGPTADAGSDSSICPGDSLRLNGSGGSSYSWSPSDSLSDPTVSDPFAYPSDTTTYQLVVTDSNTCSDTASVRIGVLPTPTVDAGPDHYLCPGDSIELDGSKAKKHAWTPDSTLDDSTSQNPIAFPKDTTSYRLRASDSNGCTGRDTTTVNVGPIVPADAGQDTAICPGDTVPLGGSPTGPPGSNFSWNPTASLDDPSDSIPLAFPSTDTSYRLTVTKDTCSGSDSVSVLLDSLPYVEAGPRKEICAGDSVQLDGKANGSSVWTPSSGLSAPSIDTPMASPADSTSYLLSVTDGNGCSNRDSMQVNVNSYPNASTSGDTAICKGDSSLIHASGGDSYSWSPSSGLSEPNEDSSLASPDSSTKYQVVVTDTNGCSDSASLKLTVHSLPPADAGNDTTICFGDSADLEAQGGQDHDWTPGGSLSDSSIADPSAGPDDSIEYIVRVTDTNGCSAEDSVLVHVRPLPDVSAGKDTGICIYDSTQLSASGASDYVWTPGDSLSDSSVADPIAFPDSSTDYVVTGKDALNCKGRDTVRITVHPRPDVDAGNSKEICRGDTATLNASGADSYLWTPDTSISDPTVQDPQAWPDSTRFYFVEGTDIHGCVNSDTVQVRVYRITAGPDTSVCKGDSVQLEAYGPNTSDYDWSPSAGLDDSSSSSPVAEIDSSIEYTVTGTDGQGCQDIDSIEVLGVSSPRAEFQSSSEAVCKGYRWRFRDESSRTDSVRWKSSDGISRGKVVERTVPYGSEEEMTLIAVKNGKCRDSSRVKVETPPFEEQFEARKANVFTPNGDGKNETFYVETNGEYASCTKLKIYNRWGQVLFRSSGNNIRWDGYNPAGKKVPSGTYFYTLVINGEKIEGELELMR